MDISSLLTVDSQSVFYTILFGFITFLGVVFKKINAVDKIISLWSAIFRTDKIKAKLNIDSISLEQEYKIIYKETIIVDNLFELQAVFLEQLQQARLQRKTLVFDFTRAVTFNDTTRDAIRYVCADAVKKNNIRFTMIFPLSGVLDDEFEYCENRAKNSCGSILIKKG
jgi:hypothetical protein